MSSGDEPTDTQLAGQGVNTEPTDPHDAPSYEGVPWTKGLKWTPKPI